MVPQYAVPKREYLRRPVFWYHSEGSFDGCFKQRFHGSISLARIMAELRGPPMPGPAASVLPDGYHRSNQARSGQGRWEAGRGVVRGSAARQAPGEGRGEGRRTGYAAAFLRRRRPNNASPARAERNSGSEAGRGTGVTVTLEI